MPTGSILTEANPTIKHDTDVQIMLIDFKLNNKAIGVIAVSVLIT